MAAAGVAGIVTVEPTPLRPEPPALKKLGLGWSYTVDGIMLAVDYLKRHGDELRGMLTITSERPGDSSHIHEAGFNFTSLASRTSLAKHLKERVGDVEWVGLIERFSVGVSRRANTGEPMMKIGNRPVEESTPLEWAVDGLFPKQAMTWWYGARASCKSQMAAFYTVCASSGMPFLDRYTMPLRVAILDFEDRDNSWERFLQMIAKGMDVPPPDVHYKRIRGPLIRYINQVARELDDEGIEALIVDPFTRAAGVTGEHQSYEEVTGNFVAVMDELDRTAIIIDHVSQASRMNPRLAADPIGTQLKMASARAGYEIRMEKTPGGNTATIGIFDRKHQMLQPIGLKARWAVDSLTFESLDLMEAGSRMALEAGTAGDRMMWQLRGGRKTVTELAEKLGVTDKSIQALVRKGIALNQIVRYDDELVGISPAAAYSSGVPVRDAARSEAV